jgi:hypothetical protein
LAKHYGDITRAAKELGIAAPDLRRLTWAKPKLLEAAHDEMFAIKARAEGEVIEASSAIPIAGVNGRRT